MAVGVSRSIAELTEVAGPAWPELERNLRRTDGCQTAEILSASSEAGAQTLYRLQVTAGSNLGALALHTGGVLIGGGWVRVLGGGCPERGLPSLAEANDLPVDPVAFEPAETAPSLLAGYDVLGGRFEINGSDPAAEGRPGEPGQMCYFQPESLEWKPMGFGHSVWLRFLILGDLADFYWPLQWPGWQDDIADIRGDEGMSFYPPLFTLKSADAIAAADRRPASIAELFSLHQELATRP